MYWRFVIVFEKLTVNMEWSKYPRSVMIVSDVLPSPAVAVHIVRKILVVSSLSLIFIAFLCGFVGKYSKTIDKKIILELHEVEVIWKYVK